MRYYPLFLDLTQARCLVIGAGQVGRRKIATLLECGVDDLLVLDPFVAPSVFSANFESPHVRFEQRTFSEGDLDGKTLILPALPQGRSTRLSLRHVVPEICPATVSTLHAKEPSSSLPVLKKLP